ncbi:MAG: 2-oxoglutarate dehydrogenase E1 component [Pseudomonadota bacterium]
MDREQTTQTSFLYGANADYIESLQDDFQGNAALDSAWRSFFTRLNDNPKDVESHVRGPSWTKPSWRPNQNGAAHETEAGQVAAKIRKAGAANGAALSEEQILGAARDSLRAFMMIRAYRARGHLLADLDPLKLDPPKYDPELDPETYGFSALDTPVFIDGSLGRDFASVNEIVEILRGTYCGTLGVEYMHISEIETRQWLQERLEARYQQETLSSEDRRMILRKLVEAEGFEKFLDIKYTATKRFGLDGGESMIPALDFIIRRAAQQDVQEIVLGMAHRGRLNVLANVMAKPHRVIFHEFKGGSSTPDDVEGSGDVKYHLGASADREFDGRTVHLSLTPNPSHLEIVDPVVLGKARAKGDQLGDAKDRGKVLPLLIHGDAAFAGQGVVAECLGLSGLKGYKTGGSLHLIVNNQIGFTTNPRYSRSSPYPSDVAKMIEAPIFHVNGDDPDAVAFAAQLAIDFRQRYRRPVVLDLICYRRYGHNETDEPAFTQPIMYKKIRAHESTLQIYGRKLVEQGVMSAEEVEKEKADWRAHLEVEYEAGQNYLPNKADWLDGRWSGLSSVGEDETQRGKTGLEIDVLRDIGMKLTEIPEDFTLHKTIRRFIDNRRKQVEDGNAIDWALAEAFAFGSLLIEGHRVRLSGQDCQRGTFSQRHSALRDQETDKVYTPLRNLSETQAPVEVINSMLSEVAVLGFDYGYTLSEPNALVAWEAQFGDFANGAQVLFDQFISAGERKWLRMSALVCLLPHGYEGQGPEHSSARLERFLQMCAEDNMQVANCTTPANYFHILRRQMKRNFRKPLILMTPKSLLRHKRCVSTLEDMGPDSMFHRLLWDDAQRLTGEKIKLQNDNDIRRVVLCSGKVYYDLYEEREKRGIANVYLLRVEQLYPFPAKSLLHELSRFPNADVVWCQEEPKNMGPWTFVESYLEWVLSQITTASKRPRYVGRAASAATATGLMSKHQKQLQAFLDEAFAG